MFIGCATLNPAVSGKTKYKVEFIDVLEGQDTRFLIDVEAPSGVNIVDLVAMKYEWEPEKGTISISGESTIDSQGQAEMIKNLAELYSSAVQSVMEGIIPSLVQVFSSTSSDSSVLDILNNPELLELLLGVLEGR